MTGCLRSKSMQNTQIKEKIWSMLPRATWKPPLIAHPKTGNPVRKVFHSPNVSNKYTEASTKNKLTDENVEKHGFTRYEKDKLTGRYNKTAGKDKRAPDVVDANQLKKIQQNGLD